MSLLDKELSFPGGANKHLMHPWENLDLTFGDLKEIIKRSLNGTLDQERYVSEKPDGQNLKVTFKDGQIKAARNKETLENPMSLEEITNKFEGRGEVQKAFVMALFDLNLAFKKLHNDVLTDIFDNGFRYLNLEIVYPETKNVINYYRKPFIQLHGLFEYDCRWNVSKTYPAAGKLIHKILEENNSTKQITFEIIPHNEIKLSKIIAGSVIEEVHNMVLDLLMKQYNLYNESDLQTYKVAYWNQIISSHFEMLTPMQKKHLIDRWARDIKTERLSAKTFGNHVFRIKAYESGSYKQDVKNCFKVFEQIFLGLGAAILKDIYNVLSNDPHETIENIKTDLQNIVNILVAERVDIDNPKIIEENQRYVSLGGHDSIAPLEGIVFIYKGNEYKLTGLFAPINQILGFYRYKR